MEKVVLEVTIIRPKEDIDDEADNIEGCLMDSWGFPESIKVSAKLISKDPL